MQRLLPLVPSFLGGKAVFGLIADRECASSVHRNAKNAVTDNRRLRPAKTKIRIVLTKILIGKTIPILVLQKDRDFLSIEFVVFSFVLFVFGYAFRGLDL